VFWCFKITGSIATKAPSHQICTKNLVELGVLVFWWFKNYGFFSHQGTKSPNLHQKLGVTWSFGVLVVQKLRVLLPPSHKDTKFAPKTWCYLEFWCFGGSKLRVL
jgi:hypothetical protein